jgi:hypothetical protein
MSEHGSAEEEARKFLRLTQSLDNNKKNELEVILVSAVRLRRRPNLKWLSVVFREAGKIGAAAVFLVLLFLFHIEATAG